MDMTTLNAALEPARVSLQADGADLDVESVQDGVARVHLVLGPETCLECIVPTAVLHQVLTMTAKKGGAPVEIDLVDPRVPAGA